MTDETVNWEDIIPEFGLMAIFGKRGMGKTALAYHISEINHEKHNIPAAIYGPPLEITKSLPDWVTVLSSLEEIEQYIGYTIIIDEGSIPLHIRRAMAKEHVLFDQIISLSRQRRQLLILCTHHSKKVDVLVIHDMDILAFKEPSTMHVKMERGVLLEYGQTAKTSFALMQASEKKRYTYVIWEDFEKSGMVINNLPSFWNDEISNAIGLAVSSQVDMRQEVFGIYRGLYQIFVESWDEIPELRERLDCVDLIEPYRKNKEQPTPELLRTIEESISNALPISGRWHNRLVVMRKTVNHLTNARNGVRVA